MKRFLSLILISFSLSNPDQNYHVYLAFGQSIVTGLLLFFKYFLKYLK